MIVTPFAPLPRTILHDATLPPGAKTLYATLKDHARQRSSCYPGYRRLCALLRVSEKTVRRWMRALIEAGYVMQTRRGHMRSNLYTLTPFAHVTTAETGILEREKLPAIKTESFQDSSTKDIREAHTFCTALPPAPDPVSVEPLPADVAALVADISREMRDTAPRSSRTRVARIIAEIDKPLDMYAAVLQARTITRKRLPRIRRRAQSGQTLPMPYFLACLARAVGAVSSPARERAAVDAVCEAVPLLPVVRQDDDRVRFWQEMNTACGVGDPCAFVALCHRPAPFPDVAWAVRLVRESRLSRANLGYR